MPATGPARVDRRGQGRGRGRVPGGGGDGLRGREPGAVLRAPRSARAGRDGAVAPRGRRRTPRRRSSRPARALAGAARRGPAARGAARRRAREFRSGLSVATEKELLALADAGRFFGPSQRAVAALTALRQRFPGSPDAGTAAFTLGRIAFENEHDYGKAASWFETYMREQPSGPLMGDAFGRLMEARLRSGDGAGARAAQSNTCVGSPEGLTHRRREGFFRSEVELHGVPVAPTRSSSARLLASRLRRGSPAPGAACGRRAAAQRAARTITAASCWWWTAPAIRSWAGSEPRSPCSASRSSCERPQGPIEASARSEHAVAAIRMLPSRKGVEVWMADETSGRSLLRQVVVDETPGRAERESDRAADRRAPAHQPVSRPTAPGAASRRRAAGHRPRAPPRVAAKASWSAASGCSTAAATPAPPGRRGRVSALLESPFRLRPQPQRAVSSRHDERPRRHGGRRCGHVGAEALARFGSAHGGCS